MKIQKKNLGGSRGEGGRAGGVRVDVNEELKFFLKIQKKIFFFFLGGGEVRGGRVGGQGGCERRIEVFVKIQKKKNWGVVGGRGRDGGVRVDVIEELKFLGKFAKKMGGGVGGFGSGTWGQVGGGVRVDVNEELKFL